MAFPEKFINELMDRSDIADVVSDYVRLTKRGGANMFGLCPFHSEKTPSFSVSQDKQMFYCFGCGKGGGVVSFIMEIENLSYPEAVAFLAKRAGMQMPEETNTAEERKRARMLALNKDAARWFYSQLSTPKGAGAVAYIQKRGISPAMTKRFGLGAAPEGWNNLIGAMHEKGYSDGELLAAGLIKRGRQGGFYDAFRGRLMFPIIDVRGNVIGFSGRILGDGEPKYLNSPETLVFNKSRNLFALNLAKKSKNGYIILAEGNVDVVSLHQAGFDSAVASLGTSLTPEHARLISRYTSEVIIAYDSDGAGLKASQRAIGIMEKLDLKVRILRMSGAKDPDEFIKTKGPEAFRRLLDDSENEMDYRLRVIKEKYDLSNAEQKIAYIKEVCSLLAKESDFVKRDIYAETVADSLPMERKILKQEIEAMRKRMLSGAKKVEERESIRAEKAFQPDAKELHFEDVESAAAEQGIIALLYLEPELIATENLPAPEDFSSPALANIYRQLCEKIRKGDAISMNTIAESLSREEMGLLTTVLQKPQTIKRSKLGISDYIRTIKDARERRESRDKGLDLLAIRDKYLERKPFR